ncbi:MAG: signal recognition particle protein [Candidatus Marinimicrobia bacterium]|jgi:signal recognition particle subunit SRP54|nr:signal recognition particle protein [Candidatus Neomarinimicrobiota bacterium]MDP6936017.1 signal recognition particle protein [Candidatus Neomarinimicrobiota bacterium]
MFEQLNDRFAHIIKNIKGQGKISEKNISDSLRDVRRALLEADVNFQAAKSFINRVKEKASGEEVFNTVTPGQQFIQILMTELSAFLGGENDGIRFNSSGKTIILLAGLQGSGKTTTAAKLACFLKKRWQKSSAMIAADLQRPAAIKQLQVLGEQIQVPVYARLDSKDVISVVKAGIAEHVQAEVIIIDTAGRLHVDDTLMDELKQVAELAKPDETLYVADGMTGQDAVTSAGAFNDALQISGVVLTKMDGDSRGGAALSIREVTGKPIKFMGTGESMKDFDLFHPERLAQRILGMGDVVSLVEKAKEVLDEKNAAKLQEKMLSNSFTLVDFQSQLAQMQKMGPMSDMLKMLPGAGKLGNLNVDDRQLKWTDAIINSMTPKERTSPEIINGSRRKRIAHGSGRPIQEVNQLLKQFHQMQKMMKKIGNKGRMKLPFGFK